MKTSVNKDCLFTARLRLTYVYISIIWMCFLVFRLLVRFAETNPMDISQAQKLLGELDGASPDHGSGPGPRKVARHSP